MGLVVASWTENTKKATSGEAAKLGSWMGNRGYLGRTNMFLDLKRYQDRMKCGHRLGLKT